VNSAINFFDQSISAVSYSWDFGGLGGSSLENPLFNFGEVDPGEIVVCLEVTSQEGCVNEICKPIPFIEEFLVYVPNAFTPDDDEYNPTFKPVFPEGLMIEDYSFVIYNRWGEIIFESKDFAIGWDGTYHGAIAKEGVYTWAIRLVGGPQQKRFKYQGHVNLLR
jgi:gliding motility-associated-like protein